MTRWLLHSPLVRLGLAGVCLSFALLVTALIGALRVGDLNGDTTTNSVPGLPGLPTPTPPYPLDQVLASVAKDPFHPERRRPGARFQLPGERAAASARRAASQATEASIRLVGTAVAANGGGFAMCTWQGGSPRIVRIGEQIGDWTLRKVLPGAAEFVTSAGGTVTVQVAKTGA